MIVPIVNLNGTSKEELVKQQMAVWKAAETLYLALAEAAPHGRDYQISPKDDYHNAREEFLQAAFAVQKIKKDAEERAFAIDQQQGK